MPKPKLVRIRGLILIVVATCLVAAYASRAESGASNPKLGPTRIVTVVKRTGIGWFERMQQGIKQFAAADWRRCNDDRRGRRDPEKQAEIIRKLIAQKPNAITVIRIRLRRSRRF